MGRQKLFNKANVSVVTNCFCSMLPCIKKIFRTIVWTKPRGLSCSVTWTRAIGVSVKMMTFPLLCASIVKPFKGNIPVITLEKQGCQRLREKMHITKVLYSNYAIDLSMGKGRSLDYFFEIRDTVARTELI